MSVVVVVCACLVCVVCGVCIPVMCVCCRGGVCMFGVCGVWCVVCVFL